MKKKNMLILLSILLLIIGAMSYIFILEDNSNKINNITYNNFTDLQLNNTIDKNISLNKNDNNSNNNSNDSIDENLSNTYKNPSSDNNYRKSDKKDSNNYYDEAMEAKLTIERNVLDKNEIAGYPVYKDPQLDAWLVPIFDKNTKKFVGSVYVHVGPGESRTYVLGPGLYSDYKDVISGKTIHKSDSNKQVGSDKSNKSSKSKKIFTVGKSNPNTALDSDVVYDIVYNVTPDTSNILSLENEQIITDSDSIDNSTC